jgi:hypothetical protein
MHSAARNLCAIAAVAMTLSAGAAAAQNFQAPGAQPFKIMGAQLAIKSPASHNCPNQAKMTGWIMTTKPGPVSYMMVRKGGSVSGPFQIQAIATPNGGMATFSQNIQIVTAIDAEYRILVAGGSGIVSNWAPLKASCKF